MRFLLRIGKLRLAKWFVPLSSKAKAKIVQDVSQLALNRRPRMCNFLEYKGEFKPRISNLSPAHSHEPTQSVAGKKVRNSRTLSPRTWSDVAFQTQDRIPTLCIPFLYLWDWWTWQWTGHSWGHTSLCWGIGSIFWQRKLSASFLGSRVFTEALSLRFARWTCKSTPAFCSVFTISRWRHSQDFQLPKSLCSKFLTLNCLLFLMSVQVLDELMMAGEVQEPSSSTVIQMVCL